jgi:hypothetical protein
VTTSNAANRDPDARLYRQSHNTGAQLSYMGHVLMEHRIGLVRSAHVSLAGGRSEREAALMMLDKDSESPRLDRNPLRLTQGGGRPTPGEAAGV